MQGATGQNGATGPAGPNIPPTDNTLSIGSPSNRWKDIYVAGNLNTNLSDGVVHSSGGQMAAAAVNLQTEVTGVLPVSNGGTGAWSASAALNNLLPNQYENDGMFLMTDGSGNVTWSTVDLSSNWVFSNGITNNSGAVGLGGTLDGNTVIASAGNSLSFTGSGKFGVGTANPQAALEVDGAILSAGVSGNTPVSGAGTRFMWVPGKSALRAGTVDGSQWNESNVGNKSIALGYNATASASYSIAIGDSVSAAGTYSIAMGHSVTTGSHSGSFIFGDGALSSTSSPANNSFMVRATGGTTFLSANDQTTGVTFPAGGGLTVTGGNLSVTGNVSTAGHLLSTSTIGSTSSTGQFSSTSVSGSDVSGTITFSSNTGSGTVTVAFGTAYASAPIVVVSPSNSDGANLQNFYVTSTTSGFTLHGSVALLQSISNGTFNYIVMH